MFSVNLNNTTKSEYPMVTINDIIQCELDCVNSISFISYPTTIRRGNHKDIEKQMYNNLIYTAKILGAYIQDVEYEDAFCAGWQKNTYNKWDKLSSVVFEKNLYRLKVSYKDKWELKTWLIDEKDSVFTHTDKLKLEINFSTHPREEEID